jgi:hypothetical protein
MFSLMAIVCPVTKLPSNSGDDIVREVTERCTRSNEEHHFSSMEKVKHILLPAFGRYGGKVVVLCVPLGDTSVFSISEVDNLLLCLVSADRLPTDSVDLLLTDSNQGVSLLPKYNIGVFI